MTFARGIWYNAAMKKYKYILFDLDGTLVYSHFGIYACFRYALEKMGREIPTDEQLAPVVGPSLFYSFTTLFQMNEEEAKRAVALYRERYSVKGMWENQPIPNSLWAVRTLYEKGFILALATSKPIEYASQIVEKQGYSSYFSAEVGSGLDGSLPTKAAVIAECLKRLNVKKEECLMVGDREYDAEGAAEVGVDCALLKIGGYAKDEELYSCGATYVFEDFSALVEFLLKT